MKLTGYTDRFSVRPGEEIAFHVHSEAPAYEARLVRLIHGDTNPAGPGFREEAVESSLDGHHTGAPRIVRKGSFAMLPAGLPTDSFALEIFARPSLPGPARQGLALWLDAAGDPLLGLSLAPDGRVETLFRGEAVAAFLVPLTTGEWYRLRLTIERERGVASMEVEGLRWSPHLPATAKVETAVPPGFGGADGPLLLAAARLEPTADGPCPHGVFNGRLARPRLLGMDGVLRAGWDFFEDAGTVRIAGLGGTADGTAVNRPARLATGPGWPGASPSPEPRPETHDAIHFHDDDVADLGWPESHRLSVPDALPSGAYALRITADGEEDHIPFFVCPRREAPGARLAVLMPTMSYLAYSNESLDASEGLEVAPRQDMSLAADRYAYVAANGLKSTYDRHRDGSGIAFATLRRPIIDMRPKARCRTFDAPHQFPADLYLVDWLTTKGYTFDVITDEILHAEGEAVLAPYRCVITGSHPEYWTSRMLDARDTWLDAGGRMMYLGGNGFYWVTGIAPDAPDVMEIRRAHGTRTWTADSGEESLSVTGERGGIWHHRGRSPEQRMGVGFTGQGFDRGRPFHRTPESRRPEYAWIFAGVEADVVGAGRSLVLGHGAAGFEVDRADRANGTPAHAVVLASTRGFSNAYLAAIERHDQLTPHLGGADPRSGVQGDIVLVPGPNGGAVFSAGSIIWSSTLSAEGYDSDTSRITANVIDAFLGDSLPGG